MILLADASQRQVHLALANAQGEILAARQHQGGAEFLAEDCQALLLEVGAQIQEIQSVCALNGPGSFTGVRAALGFAHGLCLSGRRDFRTLSTLNAYAQGLSGEVLVLMDAYPGAYYGGRGPAQFEQNHLPWEGMISHEDVLAQPAPDALVAPRKSHAQWREIWPNVHLRALEDVDCGIWAKAAWAQKPNTDEAPPVHYVQQPSAVKNAGGKV